jgi:hypothetical protein
MYKRTRTEVWMQIAVRFRFRPSVNKIMLWVAYFFLVGALVSSYIRYPSQPNARLVARKTLYTIDKPYRHAAQKNVRGLRISN